jgi:uncharacterized protein YbjQ (UPF0145 family)
MQIKQSRSLLISTTFLLLLITSCSTLTPTRELPPILTQDEVFRSHVKIGRIQVTREVYGIADYQLTPDIREWGLTAIRAEAAKIGADAVILPEVSGHTSTYLLMPTTEYRATGVAIKFK